MSLGTEIKMEKSEEPKKPKKPKKPENILKIVDLLDDNEKKLLFRYVYKSLRPPKGKWTGTGIGIGISPLPIYDPTLLGNLSEDHLFMGWDHDKIFQSERNITKKYSWPTSSTSLTHDTKKESLSSIEELKSSIDHLNESIKLSQYDQNKALLDTNQKIDEVIFKILSLSAEIHEKFIPESFGIHPDDYPVSKFISIKVYLSEYPGSDTADIISSIGEFIDSLGFLFVDEFPSKRESWWKKWFGKSKEVMTSEELVDRFKKGERAIELATLDKVQSEVNKNNADAASNLIGALDNVENAAIQLGSLLLVKVTNGSTSSIHTRQLTNKEMILLERNQSLLHQPSIIIEQLEKLSCETAA